MPFIEVSNSAQSIFYKKFHHLLESEYNDEFYIFA